MRNLDGNTKRVLRRECGFSKIRAADDGREVEGYRPKTGKWVKLGDAREVEREIRAMRGGRNG